MTCSIKDLPKILFVPWEFTSWQNVDGCDWLLPHLHADKYDGTQDTGKYDVIIYVKSRNLDMMLSNADKLQFYATPDPLWRCVDPPSIGVIDSLVDAVVVHTPGMVYDLYTHTGIRAHIVPDGIDPKFPGFTKTHKLCEPTFAWFGTSAKFNAEVKELINHMVSKLDSRLDQFKLTIISDKPVVCPIEYNYIKWTPDFCRDLLNCDVVLNPLDKEGLRSRNKSFIAWNMRLPVIETVEDIIKFLTRQARINEAERVHWDVLPGHNIKYSAERWLELIRSYGC